jgi:hypothetical protein
MALFTPTEQLLFKGVARNTASTATPFNLRGSSSYWVETVSRMSGLYTAATVPSDAQVVVIGAVTYRYKTTRAAANDIQLEATAEASLLHLIATLNGTGKSGTDYFAGTVSPAAAARAYVPRSATELTNHSVTIYATTAGTTGNLTSTTTVGSASWTAGTLTITSTTLDLQRLSPDGSYRNTMITQITLSVGQQTLAPPPGQYIWLISTCPSSDIEISRIPTAVE